MLARPRPAFTADPAPALARAYGEEPALGVATAQRTSARLRPAKSRLRHIQLRPAHLLAIVVLTLLLLAVAGAANAAPGDPGEPVSPGAPVAPADTTFGNDIISVNVNGGQPSQSIVVLLGITLLSVAPSLLLMMTSFTKILIVLSMTRNALGVQNIPPNQVLAGIALILTIFIMGPILGDINTAAVQPYLHGQMDFSAALTAGQAPLHDFMIAHTRESDIGLLLRAADAPNPATPDDVGMLTLIPAFLLSEIRAAFIIGLVIFLPFLIIDLVVSAALMSMGMMMLPPVMISLPFKILLFVLVDGWALVLTSLVGSYH